MDLDRRKFLSLSVLAGLAAGGSLAGRKLFAQSGNMPTQLEPYTGKFFLFINAGGGWDPTMFCDPKGGALNRNYTTANIARAGNIPYAPVMYTTDGGYSNQQFFEKFSPRLMVLNGIDQQTNNHDGGNRYTWSGKLEDGYPPLVALIAAALAPGQPLGFLSNGGYENTQGIVPLTRVNDLGAIARIAFPNRPDPANMMSQYHSPDTAARIARFQQARLQAMAARQSLSVFDRSMKQLASTRSGGNLLERLMQFLPPDALINATQNPIARQGYVALAAYQSGLTAAANLDVGGFDTHGDHDNQQGNALGRLLKGIDLVMDRVDALNMQDKVVVVVGSDFGRTPEYNPQNGKDHWSVTSMMMMGAGITGNTVIGGSTDTHRAKGFDLDNVVVNEASDKRLNPASLHIALRRFAGITTAEATRQFPIYGQNLGLFA